MITVFGSLRESVMVFILPVFVNNVMVASKSVAGIQNLKEKLKKHFKFYDLGSTIYLFGVAIDRNREQRSISLSQYAYVKLK